MAWPLSQDYNEAIQNPAQSFTDPELKQGQAVTNALGLPQPYSGNFADVYAMQCSRRKLAVKCFTRQIPGLQERYAEISRYLQQVRLPFMVDFGFLEQGIRVRGDWYPVLKMQWVEGLCLNAFVRENIDKPQILQNLCQIWLKLAVRLREANLAHADLQHGNVLLVPAGKAGSLSVRLVDYDGMCVPILELLKPIEVGHPAYQHPQRLYEGTFGLQIDRFSHLVIYTALRALSLSGRNLWDRFDNGDNLLFKHQDFANPGNSALFAELQKSPDAELRKLSQALAQAAQQPIEEVPLLEHLLTSPSMKRVPANDATPKPITPGIALDSESVFATVARDGKSPQRPERKRPRRGRKLIAVMASGAAAMVLAAGAAHFALSDSSERTHAAPDTQTSIAVGSAASPADPIPPVAAGIFQLQVPPSLAVTAGQSATIPVQVERQGNRQPIDLASSKVPAGVQVRSVQIGGDQDQALLQVIAAADVPEGQNYTLVIEGRAGGQVVLRDIKLTVRQRLDSNVGDTLVKADTPPQPQPPAKPPAAAGKPPADGRLPIPTDDQQAQALKIIKDLFQADYARTGRADRAALAGKLLQAAGQTTDDPVGRYVLLCQARDVAASVGEIDPLRKALDQLSRAYAVDTLAMKAGALADARKAMTTFPPLQELAKAAMALSEDAVAQESYDIALNLIDTAEKAARQMNAVPLVNQVLAHKQEVSKLQELAKDAREAERVLQDKPDDARANLTLGQYLCFLRKDWTRGLPHLSKGTDPKLKEAADLETKAAKGTATDQLAVADSWYDVAAEAEGMVKTGAQVRAHHWYSSAASQLSGIAKLKADQRVAELKRIMDARSASTKTVSPPEEFRSLFNGRDLTGWKFVIGGRISGPGQTFKAENGVIVVSGSPNGYMQTNRAYRNYHLKFDLKYANKPGNTGVLVHIQGLPTKGIWPICVEAQGFNADMGRLFIIGGVGKGQFEKFAEVQKKAIKPVGEWNTYEIVSMDGHLATYINGQKVSSGSSELKEGPIGWQSEGAEIHFRNIQIKEMN